MHVHSNYFFLCADIQQQPYNKTSGPTLIFPAGKQQDHINLSCMLQKQLRLHHLLPNNHYINQHQI